MLEKQEKMPEVILRYKAVQGILFIAVVITYALNWQHAALILGCLMLGLMIGMLVNIDKIK